MNNDNSDSKLWSPLVRELTPYVPGEQPDIDDIVKLNTNENPYPPSPKVLEAIRLGADQRLRLYPDPLSARLRSTIAGYHSDAAVSLGVENIFVGNGSDEVLAHAFKAFFCQRGVLRYPDITYSFYPVYCQLFDVPFEPIPLNQRYEIDVADYCQPVAGQRRTAGVIVANPNAPTGILLKPDAIAKLAESSENCVVVVDEAYIDFADDERASSAIALVKRYPNLLVVRTLSKSRALAGIRLGYAVGDAALIEGLNRVKDSFNSYPVDTLAEAAAIASFDDESYFQSRRKAVIDQRRELRNSLEGLGFEVLPSAANFVLVKPGGASAADIAARLRDKKIVVRYFDKPRLNDYLRITVGDKSQNEALTAALSAIFG